MNYISRNTEDAFEAGADRWLQENHVVPHHHICVDNITTALRMVKEEIGWAILPQICLDDFHGFKIPLVFRDGTPFLRNSYLLYRSHYYELPQVRLFVQSMIDYEANRPTPSC